MTRHEWLSEEEGWLEALVPHTNEMGCMIADQVCY